MLSSSESQLPTGTKWNKFVWRIADGNYKLFLANNNYSNILRRWGQTDLTVGKFDSLHVLFTRKDMTPCFGL